MVHDNEGEESLIPDEVMNRHLHEKFLIVYSGKLRKRVYILNTHVDKSVFKQHKKLFGYTDVGWTVKHPKKLIANLVKENIW